MRWAGGDPSEGMLAVARRNAPGAELVQAGAEAIPFPDASFDLVCSTTSIHRFEDKERALDEIVRVLRPRGEFHLGNINPWGMRRWWPHVFFPEGWSGDEVRFWPVDRLVAALHEAANARGLARLREPVAQDPGQTIETESTWLVLTARKAET